MTWHDVALSGTFVAMLLAGCASSAQPAGASDDCELPDPCACRARATGQTCSAQGTGCVCFAEDSGPVGAADSGSADAPVTPDLSSFLGNWSPASGSGQSDCGGQVTSLPPDPSAILAFARSGPSMLAATSSGASGCTLSLTVDGDTAVLAQSSEACSSASGASVSFTTFTLVFTPGQGTAALGADGGADAPSEKDAEPDASDSPEAGNAAATSGGVLDWQLADTDGTCVTTLHYTLVRTP